MDDKPHEEKQFQEYCATCAAIESLLEQKIYDSFESMGEAAEKFAESADLTGSTANKLLGEYRGKLVTKIAPGSRGKTELYLERLAKLYGLLDIKPDEKIVKLTQGVNHSFKYPL